MSNQNNKTQPTMAQNMTSMTKASDPIQTHHPLTQNEQANLTPQQVLQRLKAGNQRFISGNMIKKDLQAQMQATAENQYPMAVVLNCMDSRTASDLMFDQSIGDIFTLRIAGNILNDDILGSMEFGTKIMGAKLIAVIGHTNCGAMRGACQKTQLDHITPLLQKIQPAVTQAAKVGNNKDHQSNEFINQVARENVLIVMQQIRNHSRIINQLIAQGQLGIIGGIQDIANGTITFFDSDSIMPKASAR